MAEQILSVTDFKARCLDVMKMIATRRIDKVTVTRHGKPVAVVIAAPAISQQADALFGSMQHSVVVRPDFDLLEPVFHGSIEAESGRLHT